MGLELVSKHLNGIVVFKPRVFQDERGFFMESYTADDLAAEGINVDFVQDNHSGSIKNVLRGMHFQWDKPMGKLIRVTVGRAFIAEVDIRVDSPTLGQWWGTEVSAENRLVVWVPPGFANGFASLSDFVEMQYKCTAKWNPKAESGILWCDGQVGIDWKIDSPILSDKDAKAQTLAQWLERPEAQNFRVGI